VDGVIDWLEPRHPMPHPRPGAAQRVRAHLADRVRGSRASGFCGEAAHFYTWQPERADVVSWLAELERRAPVQELPSNAAPPARS
jgi:hypothetical protein